MDAATTIAWVRREAGLSLRALAARAGTSHATIAAYESGRKVPNADTLQRVVRAAGFDLSPSLTRSASPADDGARGRELIDALELAALFPSRPRRHLDRPRFPAA